MSYLIQIFFLSFVFISTNAHSFETARQLSFAGSGALNPKGVDALNLNPASLTIHSTFSFGGGYHFGEPSEDLETKAYYVWFKDSISSSFNTKRNKAAQKRMDGMSGFPLAAAFSFSSLEVEDSDSRRVLDYKAYNLGVAALATKRMSFGLAVNYFDSARGLGFKDSFVTTGFGLVYWLQPKLKVGISGIDLLNTAEPELLEELKPQRIRVSGAYSLGSMQIYADVERLFSGELKGNTNYGAGVEAPLREFLSVRLGLFQRSELDDMDFGAGLSFAGPKLQIHYGFRQNRETETFLNSIDFSMPL